MTRRVQAKRNTPHPTPKPSTWKEFIAAHRILAPRRPARAPRRSKLSLPLAGRPKEYRDAKLTEPCTWLPAGMGGTLVAPRDLPALYKLLVSLTRKPSIGPGLRPEWRAVDLVAHLCWASFMEQVRVHMVANVPLIIAAPKHILPALRPDVTKPANRKSTNRKSNKE